MKTIQVSIKNQDSYNVHIKHGLLSEIDKYIDGTREIVVITDDFIPKQYLELLQTKINVSTVFEVPAGENSKSMEMANSLLNELVDLKFSRGVILIALGGGVVGDLTGFIASIYMRGVDFIQIPTTLLSQIDSSIGGKVGINADNMKNAIGSFYQPKVVLIDPNTLDTLDEKQFNNGMGELIKHGMIAGKGLFLDLLNNNPKEHIEELIYQSLQIKREVVEQDVYDRGVRQLLNYGHTIGHAIEQNSNYELLHGECVAIGMSIMAKGYPYEADLHKILNKYNLPTSYKYNKNEIYEYIKTDKKVTNNKLNIILVEEVGKGFIKTIDIEEIKKYM